MKLQPLVLLNICDAYIRRSEHQGRVIGTLLGKVVDGVVHVQNCYAVPHNESNDQARSLMDLHTKQSFLLTEFIALVGDFVVKSPSCEVNLSAGSWTLCRT